MGPPAAVLLHGGPPCPPAVLWLVPMETVPSLIQLNLGDIRDAGMPFRVQSMQSKALERLRQERLKRTNSAPGDGGGNGGSPPPMLKRRSLNDTMKNASKVVGGLTTWQVALTSGMASTTTPVAAPAPIQ